MKEETIDRYFFGLSCLYNELNNNNVKISSYGKALRKCHLPASKMRAVLINLNVIYYRDGLIKWNNTFMPTKTLAKIIYKNLHINKLNSNIGIIRKFIQWIY